MSETNTKWLLEYLENEKNLIGDCIVDRARTNGSLEDNKIGWLFEIDNDNEGFANWDKDELENHNYDLGRYKMIVEIIYAVEYQLELKHETKEN